MIIEIDGKQGQILFVDQKAGGGSGSVKQALLGGLSRAMDEDEVLRWAAELDAEEKAKKQKQEKNAAAKKKKRQKQQAARAKAAASAEPASTRSAAADDDDDDDIRTTTKTQEAIYHESFAEPAAEVVEEPEPEPVRRVPASAHPHARAHTPADAREPRRSNDDSNRACVAAWWCAPVAGGGGSARAASHRAGADPRCRSVGGI